MKISCRWLREFAETELPPEAIADRLVNAGIEVASVQPLVEGLSGVVIAEIEAIPDTSVKTVFHRPNVAASVA